MDQDEKARAVAYAQREIVDGRWVFPGGSHGKAETFVYKGCRCQRCETAAAHAQWVLT